VVLAVSLLSAAAWTVVPLAAVEAQGGTQTPAQPSPQAPPRILLDASPRAVEYQLGRLSNDELARLERKEDDPRYRPVYVALLTRTGLGREYFDEGLAALAKMDKASPARVLIDALPKLKEDDTGASARLLQVLFAQPPDALRKERDALAKAAEGQAPPLVLRAAYGVMMIVDGNPQAAWASAATREGHLTELLRAVPQLGGADALRASLFEPVSGLLAGTTDPATRVAAVAALGWTRPDAATFRLLAREVTAGTDPAGRAAAIRSIQALPRSAWPAGEVEPVARAIVAEVGKIPAGQRTQPAAIEAMQLAEALSESLAEEPGRGLRRELRALGVRVIRIQAVPEQMLFDRKWFAVEAGKPVQIVLYNPDAMSHNLVVGAPGSLKELGTQASTMAIPTDPKAKPYVPASPLVLQATRLLNWGETERLNFVAPKEPGEYVYVCTFPGHWVRMYGVMLVVADLEKWEAAPSVPKDPMTGQPYAER
jgi:azurin